MSSNLHRWPLINLEIGGSCLIVELQFPILLISYCNPLRFPSFYSSKVWHPIFNKGFFDDWETMVRCLLLVSPTGRHDIPIVFTTPY